MTTCCYAILGNVQFHEGGKMDEKCHSHQFFLILFLSKIKKPNATQLFTAQLGRPLPRLYYYIW